MALEVLILNLVLFAMFGASLYYASRDHKRRLAAQNRIAIRQMRKAVKAAIEKAAAHEARLETVEREVRLKKADNAGFGMTNPFKLMEDRFEQEMLKSRVVSVNGQDKFVE